MAPGTPQQPDAAVAPPAAHCVTIAEDKRQVAVAGAFEYLGPRHVPFTDGLSIFYRRGDLTLFSPVIRGCVSKSVIPVGLYRAEVGV